MHVAKLMYSLLLTLVLLINTSCQQNLISDQALSQLEKPIKIELKDINNKLVTKAKVSVYDPYTKEKRKAFFHKSSQAFYFSSIDLRGQLKIESSKYEKQLLDFINYPEGGTIFMSEKNKPYYIYGDQKVPCYSFSKRIGIMTKRVGGFNFEKRQAYKQQLDSLGFEVDENFYTEAEKIGEVTGQSLRWFGTIYRKKDKTTFSEEDNLLIKQLRSIDYISVVGPILNYVTMAGPNFSIVYLPDTSVSDLELLFSNYPIEIIQHDPTNRTFYLKTGEFVNEQIRNIWNRLFEDENIQFVYPKLHNLVIDNL